MSKPNAMTARLACLLCSTLIVWAATIGWFSDVRALKTWGFSVAIAPITIVGFLLLAFQFCAMDCGKKRTSRAAGLVMLIVFPSVISIDGIAMPSLVTVISLCALAAYEIMVSLDSHKQWMSGVVAGLLAGAGIFPLIGHALNSPALYYAEINANGMAVPTAFCILYFAGVVALQHNAGKTTIEPVATEISRAALISTEKDKSTRNAIISAGFAERTGLPEHHFRRVLDRLGG